MTTIEIIRKTIRTGLKHVQHEEQLNVSNALLEKIAEELTIKIENRLRMTRPGLLEEQEWPEA